MNDTEKIERAIRWAFTESGRHRVYSGGYQNYDNNRANAVILEVPETGDEFPIIAPSRKQKILLYCTGADVEYKTPAGQLMSALPSDYKRYGLVRIEAKRKDRRPNNVYYISQGLILDEQFNPILALTKRCHIDESDPDNPSYCRYDHIIRMHPSCFLVKDDAMKTLLAGKLFTTILGAPIFYNDIRNNPILIIENSFPFTISKVCPPTINTTNESLLNCALNNFNNPSLCP